MTQPACVACRWWERNTPRKGFCRAEPPQCNSDGDGEWPTTLQGDWCGKFAARGSNE